MRLTRGRGGARGVLAVFEGVDARLLAVVGAACISVSAILMKLSEASAPTAGFFRCVLALPVLFPIALVEWRRVGGRPTRRHLNDVVAGMFLGVDMVFWGLCIERLGAGIATVLANVQVVIVPLLALLIYRERPSLRFWLMDPVMLVGVALAAGILGVGDVGSSDDARLLGALAGVAAGAAYAGYLFLLRGRGTEAGGTRHQAQPVFFATVGAALACLLLGPFIGGMDFTPGWSAFGWLLVLALSGQVCGWLLIAGALRRLRSNVGAALLLLQPVLAVVFSMALIGERPGGWQLFGCAVVVVGVWFTSSSFRRPRSSAERRRVRDAEARSLPSEV